MAIEYTLQRGNYNRASVKILRNGSIIVTVPHFWTQSNAEEFLSSKRSWVEKTLAKIRELSNTRLQVPKGSLLYLGEIYTFKRNISMGRFYSIDENSKTVTTGLDLTSQIALKKFYKERADFILMGRLHKMAEEKGFTYSSASVRNTKMRWGSCSSKKTISLSERLIVTPIFVIDAIALHELVHTEIMNHSDRFYQRLKSVCPFYAEADKWLKEKYPDTYPPDAKK